MCIFLVFLNAIIVFINISVSLRVVDSCVFIVFCSCGLDIKENIFTSQTVVLQAFVVIVGNSALLCWCFGGITGHFNTRSMEKVESRFLTVCVNSPVIKILLLRSKGWGIKSHSGQFNQMELSDQLQLTNAVACARFFYLKVAVKYLKNCWWSSSSQGQR